MKQLNIQETQNMLLFMAERLMASKELLCEIDGKVGDGDHGFGIERGFKAVKAMLEENTYATINELFKASGMTMLHSMGGASGVIFSQLFLGAAAIPEEEKLTSEILAQVMRKGLEKIKATGKAQLGDKTMIDALEPAVLELEQESSGSLEEATGKAMLAAENGVEKTKEYPAKFGRAKFVYERSIGVQDAGATTVFLMFEAMHTYISQQNE
ncbi:dihydroxyacetone kinase subunit DhaL [Oceanobacillus sp. CFH 90083]|uniref:dihydroxyacetone kinase subunit DhaL n=1 Tax=Oceanobacillus sp. CFH 90083 TaxID=2592336 RepID=UPI001D143638|nr:dihydroxyacetone kinase subunit DhaL [Oceanobacillus sp. CFH 90083]